MGSEDEEGRIIVFSTVGREGRGEEEKEEGRDGDGGWRA